MAQTAISQTGSSNKFWCQSAGPTPFRSGSGGTTGFRLRTPVHVNHPEQSASQPGYGIALPTKTAQLARSRSGDNVATGLNNNTAFKNPGLGLTGEPDTNGKTRKRVDTLEPTDGNERDEDEDLSQPFAPRFTPHNTRKKRQRVIEDDEDDEQGEFEINNDAEEKAVTSTPSTASHKTVQNNVKSAPAKKHRGSETVAKEPEKQQKRVPLNRPRGFSGGFKDRGFVQPVKDVAPMGHDNQRRSSSPQETKSPRQAHFVTPIQTKSIHEDSGKSESSTKRIGNFGTFSRLDCNNQNAVYFDDDEEEDFDDIEALMNGRPSKGREVVNQPVQRQPTTNENAANQGSETHHSLNIPAETSGEKDCNTHLNSNVPDQQQNSWSLDSEHSIDWDASTLEVAEGNGKANPVGAHTHSNLYEKNAYSDQQQIEDMGKYLNRQQHHQNVVVPSEVAHPNIEKDHAPNSSNVPPEEPITGPSCEEVLDIVEVQKQNILKILQQLEVSFGRQMPETLSQFRARAENAVDVLRDRRAQLTDMATRTTRGVMDVEKGVVLGKGNMGVTVVSVGSNE